VLPGPERFGPIKCLGGFDGGSISRTFDKIKTANKGGSRSRPYLLVELKIDVANPSNSPHIRPDSSDPGRG
jgi:hypothetical protein